MQNLQILVTENDALKLILLN